jgi:hypothetical protein
VISDERAGHTVQGTLEQDEEIRIQITMGKLVQAAANRAEVYGFSMGQLSKELESAGIDPLITSRAGKKGVGCNV